MEQFFRIENCHEDVIAAVLFAKSLAERHMHAAPLIKVEVSEYETRFNCPNCGKAHFTSKHPKGCPIVDKIVLTPDDNYCNACGKRIVLNIEDRSEDVEPLIYIEGIDMHRCS